MTIYENFLRKSSVSIFMNQYFLSLVERRFSLIGYDDGQRWVTDKHGRSHKRREDGTPRYGVRSPYSHERLEFLRVMVYFERNEEELDSPGVGRSLFLE